MAAAAAICTMTGDDDMPAHIRTALTTQTMSLSVVEGQLLLGTWQAVYLWSTVHSPSAPGPVI